MTTIALAGSGYYPSNPDYLAPGSGTTQYPGVSGPIGDAPSSPTGGVTTTPKPNIDYGTRTFIPTLGPIAPNPPAPLDGPICAGACNAPSESPIPGPTIGAPLPPGGNGMGAEGTAPHDCSCDSGDIKAFFSDVPTWVWVLIGAAILLRKG